MTVTVKVTHVWLCPPCHGARGERSLLLNGLPGSRTGVPIGVERDDQRVDARGIALAVDKDAVAVGGLPDAVEDAEGSKFAQR